MCASALGTLAFMCFLWRLCSSKHTRKCYTAERERKWNVCAPGAPNAWQKRWKYFLMPRNGAHVHLCYARSAELYCVCQLFCARRPLLAAFLRLTPFNKARAEFIPRRHCARLQIKIEHSIVHTIYFLRNHTNIMSIVSICVYSFCFHSSLKLHSPNYKTLQSNSYIQSALSSLQF